MSGARDPILGWTPQQFAEARAEFADWFRRHDRGTGGAQGIHRGHAVTYEPWCTVRGCGHATKAFGVCSTHYAIAYRRLLRRARGLRIVLPARCGHRHHDALCAICYPHFPTTLDALARLVPIRRAVAAIRRRAAVNDVCGHRDRPHHARGNCYSCYHRSWRAHRAA